MCLPLSVKSLLFVDAVVTSVGQHFTRKPPPAVMQSFPRCSDDSLAVTCRQLGSPTANQRTETSKLYAYLV